MKETKLAEENSETQEPTPYTVFTLAIVSPATKEKYLQRLEQNPIWPDRNPI
ncbi:MAG TPA: hypothetical protein VKA09_07805 [Nitrososphaeraceae archaeon]|nr:hypothetical protein [Nitrososphaeraceae archaeon]